MAPETLEPKDSFKDVMAVLIAIVVLVTAIAAWRASVAGNTAGFEDYYALTATLNAGETNTVNTAAAYNHYDAFTNYAVNREMQSQLEQGQSETETDEQRVILEYQLEQAHRLASTNLNFFPARYVDKTGEYQIKREMDEQWADAERKLDLNTDRHLKLSDQQDAKTFSFVSTTILLGVSLLFYTTAGALHPERKLLRWSAAIGGTLCRIGRMLRIFEQQTTVRRLVAARLGEKEVSSQTFHRSLRFASSR